MVGYLIFKYCRNIGRKNFVIIILLSSVPSLVPSSVLFGTLLLIMTRPLPYSGVRFAPSFFIGNSDVAMAQNCRNYNKFKPLRHKDGPK